MKYNRIMIYTWAILATIVSLYFLIGPVIQKTIKSVSHISLSSEERTIDSIMTLIINIEHPRQRIENAKQLVALHEEITRIDSIKVAYLVSYNTALFNLYYSVTDTSVQKSLERKINWVINRLLVVDGYDPYILLRIGAGYRRLGAYDNKYYCIADSIYDRIEYLASVDSIKIPKYAEDDKVTFLDELMATVVDNRCYSKIIQRISNRKYDFPE